MPGVGNLLATCGRGFGPQDASSGDGSIAMVERQAASRSRYRCIGSIASVCSAGTGSWPASS